MKILNQFIGQFLIAITMVFTLGNSVAYAEESNVLSVVTGDWNKDKNIDAAVLMKNKDDLVEIYIFLGSQKKPLRLAAYKKDIAWIGAMGGTLPHLKTKKENGSLLIHSENDSVGRNRWQLSLTVVYRSQTFIIAGYTYSSYDTLILDNISHCDVNLLTGKGISNDKGFKIKAQKIKLKDWTEDYVPDECD